MTHGGKTIDEVYYDRNTAAFALLRSLDLLGYDVYWRATDKPRWPAIAARLGYGEVGWHVPYSELEPHDDWLQQSPDDVEYYSRDEKNDRLYEFATGGPLGDSHPALDK